MGRRVRRVGRTEDTWGEADAHADMVGGVLGEACACCALERRVITDW